MVRHRFATGSSNFFFSLPFLFLVTRLVVNIRNSGRCHLRRTSQDIYPVVVGTLASPITGTTLVVSLGRGLSRTRFSDSEGVRRVGVIKCLPLGLRGSTLPFVSQVLMLSVSGPASSGRDPEEGETWSQRGSVLRL